MSVKFDLCYNFVTDELNATLCYTAAQCSGGTQLILMGLNRFKY